MNDLAARRPQRVELQGKVLVIRRDAGIPIIMAKYPRWILAYPFERFSPFQIKWLQSGG